MSDTEFDFNDIATRFRNTETVRITPLSYSDIGMLDDDMRPIYITANQAIRYAHEHPAMTRHRGSRLPLLEDLRTDTSSTNRLTRAIRQAEAIERYTSTGETPPPIVRRYCNYCGNAWEGIEGDVCPVNTNDQCTRYGRVETIDPDDYHEYRITWPTER